VASCGPASSCNTTPQTLSTQIKLLEDRLGCALFRKRGRGLELTDDGRTALGYADQIFALGSELEAAIGRARRGARLTSASALPTRCPRRSPTGCWSRRWRRPTGAADLP
jgi:DNA-binding transcriptional LysR family regulator